MGRLALVGVPPRAHYRRLLRHLGDLGHRVVTVDADASEVFAGLVEASLHVPLRDEPVTAALRAHHERRPIDGVALFHEMTVEVSTRAAAALGLPHFPLDRIAACTDKLRMRRWMAECGVRCPRFAGVSTVEQARAACRDIGYPAVVKPVRGGASYGVTRLDDESAVDRFFDRTDIFWEPREFIVERYLSGHEISVESVIGDGGRHSHAAVFDKPQALDGPYFLEDIFVTAGCPASGPLSAACDTVSDMVARLGLERCITHTELRLTGDGPVVLEFGLRPIGWPGPLCVEIASGVDLIAAMAAIACGDPFEAEPRPTGVVSGWRYLTVAAPGVVSELPPVDDIGRRPGVVDVSVWARRGDRVGTPPADFNYIKGYLAAQGPSVESVTASLTTADWVLATT